MSLVRKEDYLGPVSGWNKKSNNIPKRFKPDRPHTMFKTVDVDTGFNGDSEIKKEEPMDGFESIMYSSVGQNSHLAHDKEIKIEPEDECKPDAYL